VIKIGTKEVGKERPCFIIAEAGVNHNGSLKRALQMVDAAKAAGADAIKFQTFRTEEIVTQDAPKAKYQRGRSTGKTQFEMLKKLELHKQDFVKLYGYCKKKRIIFLSTPFDLQSAEFLFKLGMTAFKISSGDLNNLPLLSRIAKYRKPIIISTGMSNISEIKDTLSAIRSAGNSKIVLLHCTSNYPADLRSVNLKAIKSMESTFKLPIGYSDHTLGIEVAMAAAVLGAAIIEKHFTIDLDLPGPDHKASLNPEQLQNMVQSIRNIEEAMGSDKKNVQRSEFEVKKVIRKSIVAANWIRKGTRITSSMLKIKRPGTGLEPKELPKIVGKYARIDIGKDKMIKWGSVRP
jgi:N-acetylneuraminate synthase/N,N'-diacetyllegionaminate synthase